MVDDNTILFTLMYDNLDTLKFYIIGISCDSIWDPEKRVKLGI